MVMTVATSRFEAERMEAQEAKARRVQRLKEVRAAESRVAAQTRQAFRKAAAARTDELLGEARGAWEADRAEQLARKGLDIANALHTLGAGQATARQVMHAQAEEAGDGMALWRAEIYREGVRGRAALGVEAEDKEEKRVTKQIAANRRDLVTRVEKERAAAAAAAAQEE